MRLRGSLRLCAEILRFAALRSALRKGQNRIVSAGM